MVLQHTNPTQKRYDRKSGEFIEARAPYNFIPLPEKVVPAPSLLDFDVYHSQALSCWVDVEMITLSPTYVRGMMKEEQYQQLSGKDSDELTSEEKGKLANPFSIGATAVIPGSSLRGMIRSLVEIASYGRIRWVAKEPTFTFRAVAAQRDDPLAEHYQDVIGRFAANVRAGYLRHDRESDRWSVQPAKLPKSIAGCESSRDAFLKVKEERIGSKDIPGFVRLTSPNYRPAWHHVRFDARMSSGARRTPLVERIGGEGSGYRVEGVLVCSGNMAESGRRSGTRSKRTSHTLILEADPVYYDQNGRPHGQKPILIRDQAVRDYLAGLTPFQRDDLEAWSKGKGCLADNAPVFYVAEGNEVVCFGHSPNFRIPMRLSGSTRAATPQDFIPLEMRNDKRPDFSDAMFGWVEDKGTSGNSPLGHRAGHIFVGDARCTSDLQDIWWKNSPIVPHTLASPKSTTFQHYLVQDKKAGHDPDGKSTLAHYGTSPADTQIRGFKRYWHKGSAPDIEANEKERGLEKQLTRIKPLKVGVRFKFRIHFENLHPAELGALLWALTLPGVSGKQYSHTIGMGKPLGMGAVQLSVTDLKIVNRQARYSELLSHDAWHLAAEKHEPDIYIHQFEKYVLDELGETNKGKRRLADLERIQMLLAMHEWAGPPASETHYMEIEREAGRDVINEYKERPVLPDPLAVRAKQIALQETKTQQTAMSNPPSIPSGYETGKVIKYSLGPLKDFGFIKPDSGGDDVYVNRNKLAKGVQTLTQGQRVQYKRVPSAKGFQAIDVQVIG